MFTELAIVATLVYVNFFSSTVRRLNYRMLETYIPQIVLHLNFYTYVINRDTLTEYIRSKQNMYFITQLSIDHME